MSTDKVAISAEVMERVHAELVRAILETPDYIQKVVDELLKKAGTASGYGHRDDDHKRPLFERLLRRELNTMIEQSLRRILRERYAPSIDAALEKNLAKQEAVDGSLVNALRDVLKDDWRLNAQVSFKFEREA